MAAEKQLKSFKVKTQKSIETKTVLMRMIGGFKTLKWKGLLNGSFSWACVATKRTCVVIPRNKRLISEELQPCAFHSHLQPPSLSHTLCCISGRGCVNASGPNVAPANFALTMFYLRRMGSKKGFPWAANQFHSDYLFKSNFHPELGRRKATVVAFCWIYSQQGSKRWRPWKRRIAVVNITTGSGCKLRKT